VAIYDSNQAFDTAGAGMMSAVLLVFSIVAIAVVSALSRRVGSRQ
jgi:molybdate transport system permease protein